MIRAVTSEDLIPCAGLFVKVFSEWPYEESWTIAQALILTCPVKIVHSMTVISFCSNSLEWTTRCWE